MIDSNGTRYVPKQLSKDVWVLDGWQDFLVKNSLYHFDDFLKLTGELVDINKRSNVQKVKIGDVEKNYYLKIHDNYNRKDFSTGFKKIPVIQIELANLMHYARCGFDALEPIAWGWKRTKEGDKGFLLLEELQGYTSLKEYLSMHDRKKDSLSLTKLANALADMVATIHNNGLVHQDLFSWHIFVKKQRDKFIFQPIDLERTIKKSKTFYSNWVIFFKKAQDLAVLHLTVPWPLVRFTVRLRFFLRYKNHQRLTKKDKWVIKLILRISKRLGKRRRKYKPYGIADRLSTSL